MPTMIIVALIVLIVISSLAIFGLITSKLTLGKYRGELQKLLEETTKIYADAEKARKTIEKYAVLALNDSEETKIQLILAITDKTDKAVKAVETADNAAKAAMLNYNKVKEIVTTCSQMLENIKEGKEANSISAKTMEGIKTQVAQIKKYNEINTYTKEAKKQSDIASNSKRIATDEAKNYENNLKKTITNLEKISTRAETSKLNAANFAVLAINDFNETKTQSFIATTNEAGQATEIARQAAKKAGQAAKDAAIVAGKSKQAAESASSEIKSIEVAIIEVKKQAAAAQTKVISQAAGIIQLLTKTMANIKSQYALAENYVKEAEKFSQEAKNQSVIAANAKKSATSAAVKQRQQYANEFLNATNTAISICNSIKDESEKIILNPEYSSLSLQDTFQNTVNDFKFQIQEINSIVSGLSIQGDTASENN